MEKQEGLKAGKGREAGIRGSEASVLLQLFHTVRASEGQAGRLLLI
jgi:hypothetical protein